LLGESKRRDGACVRLVVIGPASRRASFSTPPARRGWPRASRTAGLRSLDAVENLESVILFVSSLAEAKRSYVGLLQLPVLFETSLSSLGTSPDASWCIATIVVTTSEESSRSARC
jgi:hypothetical protein